MHFRIQIFATLLCPLLFAEDSDLIHIDLSPFPVNQSPSNDSAEAVTGSAIELQRPADLAEMLSSASPGVQLVRKGGASNDLRLNGLGEDNINVLQDGQRIYCACPNRMDPPASHAETTAIERIEVVSGAFDLRHAGALGGTVSVVTRDPQPGLRSEIDVSLGSFSFQRYGLAVEGGSTTLAALLSGSFATSDPYEDGSGRSLTAMPESSAWPLDDYLPAARKDAAYRERRIASKLAWHPSEHSHHVLQLGYRKGTDILYPALRMDADLNESISASLQSTWAPGSPVVDTVKLNLYYSTTQHDMSDARRVSSQLGMGGASRPAYVLERGYYMQSLAETATGGLHLELEKRAERVTVRTGLEAYVRDWKIENRLGAGMPAAGPAMEIFNHMIPDTRTVVTGAFAEADWALNDRWTIAPGIRIDRYETRARAEAPTLAAFRGAADDPIEDLALSAKLLARARFGPNAFLEGGVGHTARPPDGRERYLNLQRPGTMPNWIGNPGLDPTHLTELTLGGGWANDRWTLHARVFHRLLEDYIYPEKVVGGTKPVQTFTALDAHLTGTECSATGQLAEHWWLRAAATWQRGEKSDTTPTQPDRDLAEIPSAALHAELRYRFASGFVLAELRHTAAQDRIDETLGERRLEASTAIHLRGGFELPIEGTLYLGIENVFDETYSLHNAYVRNPFGSDAVINEPGRSFYLRYRRDF